MFPLPDTPWPLAVHKAHSRNELPFCNRLILSVNSDQEKPTECELEMALEFGMNRGHCAKSKMNAQELHVIPMSMQH